jgi:DNA-binding MarR family transcriptional regulator
MAAKLAVPLLPCACASLRRAARAVTSAYTREFRTTGLNPTKFTLLWTLDRMGPNTQGALANLLAIDSATLTRTLAPLARRGWIRAERGVDRRQIRWEITTTGQRRLVGASHAWKRAQNRLRDRLGVERWNRLLADLSAVSGAAQTPFEG